LEDTRHAKGVANARQEWMSRRGNGMKKTSLLGFVRKREDHLLARPHRVPPLRCARAGGPRQEPAPPGPPELRRAPAGPPVSYR
jgi:hypothetical protein